MGTTTEDLILQLAHYDGSRGDIVRRWLSDLHMARIAHGWKLATDIYRVSDNMYRAEKILQSLEDHGFIERKRMDLNYAPEIRYFGVGGILGDKVERTNSSLLFTYAPTERLAALINHSRQTDKEAK